MFTRFSADTAQARFQRSFPLPRRTVAVCDHDRAHREGFRYCRHDVEGHAWWRAVYQWKEVSAANGDRLLVLPEKISIVAYPEEFKDWDTAGLDGVEVYNVFTNAQTSQSGRGVFRCAVVSTRYPDLIFALYLQRPDEEFEKVGPGLARARLTGSRRQRCAREHRR